jgi:hypothetical protein
MQHQARGRPWSDGGNSFDGESRGKVLAHQFSQQALREDQALRAQQELDYQARIYQALQLAQQRIAQQRARRSELPRPHTSTPQAPQAPQGPHGPQAPPAAPTTSSRQQLKRDRARVERHRVGKEAEKLRQSIRYNSDISQLKTAPSRVCSCGITAKQWATEGTRTSTTIGDWQNHKSRCKRKRKAEAKAAMDKDERLKKQKRPLRFTQGNAAP